MKFSIFSHSSVESRHMNLPSESEDEHESFVREIFKAEAIPHENSALGFPEGRNSTYYVRLEIQGGRNSLKIQAAE